VVRLDRSALVSSTGAVRALPRLLAAYPLALVGLSLLNAVAPQQTGFLAMMPILAPHLFLVGLLLLVLLLPLAVVRRDRALIGALALFALVAVFRFGDEWVSLPAGAASDSSLQLVSWNLELGARSPTEAVDLLLREEADVIALQELTDDAAAAIEADEALRARYPYRVLVPDASVLGIGLLSAFPISQDDVLSDPVLLIARLDLGGGQEVTVLNAHPLPGRIGTLSFDATQRDAALDRVRTRIDELLDGDVAFIVLGDYNVASSEPAYGRLAAGLRDVHREVGFGAGWTWRPNRFEPFGIGLLRIDYVLTSPGITPRSIEVDCQLPGDHCLVSAAVALPPPDTRGTRD
jgi:endonuclease/exonuclease/phosphatase (EEP) superfamily protein YafD